MRLLLQGTLEGYRNLLVARLNPSLLSRDLSAPDAEAAVAAAAATPQAQIVRGLRDPRGRLRRRPPHQCPPRAGDRRPAPGPGRRGGAPRAKAALERPLAGGPTAPAARRPGGRSTAPGAARAAIRPRPGPRAAGPAPEARRRNPGAGSPRAGGRGARTRRNPAGRRRRNLGTRRFSRSVARGRASGRASRTNGPLAADAARSGRSSAPSTPRRSPSRSPNHAGGNSARQGELRRARDGRRAGSAAEHCGSQSNGERQARSAHRGEPGPARRPAPDPAADPDLALLDYATERIGRRTT